MIFDHRLFKVFLQKKDEASTLDGAGSEVAVDTRGGIIPIRERHASGGFAEEARKRRDHCLFLFYGIREGGRPNEPIALRIILAAIKGRSIGIGFCDINIHLALTAFGAEETKAEKLIKCHVIF